MRKTLRCGRIVPGCEFVAHADSEEELLRKAVEHARETHGMDHVSEALKAKIREAIEPR